MWMNGGSILTDHGAIHTLWGCIKKDHQKLLWMYITNEGQMLRRRFVEDPVGFGDDVKARLARHRLAAMGCSKRGVARKLHTPEHQAGMEELLRAPRSSTTATPTCPSTSSSARCSGAAFGSASGTPSSRRRCVQRRLATLAP